MTEAVALTSHRGLQILPLSLPKYTLEASFPGCGKSIRGAYLSPHLVQPLSSCQKAENHARTFLLIVQLRRDKSCGPKCQH